MTYSGTYPYYGLVNAPAWYLSAMLLAMAVLYPIMIKYKKTFVIWASIVVIFMLGISWQRWEELTLYNYIWDGWYYRGLYRAFMELLLGGLCYKLAKRIKIIPLTQLSRILLTVVEWGGYIGSIIYMCMGIESNPKFSWHVIIVLAVSVTLTYSQVSYSPLFIHWSVFKWLGVYSYSLFLGHWVWVKNLLRFLPEVNVREIVLLYLGLSFVTGLVIMYISKGLLVFWKNHRKQIENVSIK